MAKPRGVAGASRPQAVVDAFAWCPGPYSRTNFVLMSTEQLRGWAPGGHEPGQARQPSAAAQRLRPRSRLLVNDSRARPRSPSTRGCSRRSAIYMSDLLQRDSSSSDRRAGSGHGLACDGGRRWRTLTRRAPSAGEQPIRVQLTMGWASRRWCCATLVRWRMERQRPGWSRGVDPS